MKDVSGVFAGWQLAPLKTFARAGFLHFSSFWRGSRENAMARSTTEADYFVRGFFHIVLICLQRKFLRIRFLNWQSASGNAPFDSAIYPRQSEHCFLSPAL